MTARATTLKGSGAGGYYVHELPNYYLDSGEPRGLWTGKGAERLGLAGEIEDTQFLNVMGGVHPHDPSLLLGRRYGEDSVRGVDVTASAPKSVSLLMGIGDEPIKRHALDAHDIAVGLMTDWIEANATTRFRVNGEVHTVDAEGLIVGLFRQHTSRALDPQLHTHVVVANRVLSPDGRWLALDARHLKKFQQAASTRYHHVLRNELTSRLGVEWEPVVNGIAEIAHIPPGLLEEFSSRTESIERRLDEKVDRFVDNLDREPTPREYWKLEREAVLDSRPSKAKDVSAAELHQRWDAQAQGLGIHPDEFVEDITRQVTPRVMTSEIAAQAIDDAIVVLSDRSTWHPTDLTRAIEAALPTDVVVSTGEIPAMLDHFTNYAIEQRCVNISRPIPDDVSLRDDGRPVTESPIDVVLTTPEILAQERRLLGWAERRLDHPAVDSVDAPQRSTVTLTIPQAEAAAAVAGNAHLTLVVGPAGTGKTTALRPAVDQLRAEGRVVFGVAPSAAAADVLHRETGVDADTIDKLLTEHSLQRPPDHRYDLPVNATLIVDEAGMLGSNKFDRLANLADERGWRVALVGDPMQFTAVGRGGMFEHLIDTHGAIELDRVHRFSEAWEASASLRLRRGDPTVADVYDLHGRLHGGTRSRMQDQALDVWHQARANGETVVLATPDNDTVRQLNVAAQQRRIEAGELSTRGRTVNTGGYQLHVGDEIVTRRNHRQLTTSRSQPVRNRDQWTIDTVHRNGDLTVTGDSGIIRLPTEYVKQHVELGYAQTSHATQGRTVDRSILYLDGPTDARGIYVPLTRGRHSNDAYIATTPDSDALDVFAESVGRIWIDQPAVARQAELASTTVVGRPGTIGPADLRDLLDRQAVIEGDLAANKESLKQLPRRIDTLTYEVASTTEQREQSMTRLRAAEETLARRDRPFRRRGHEQEIARAKQTVNTAPDQIGRLTSQIQGCERDIASARAELTAVRRFGLRAPGLETELADITDRLGDDRHIRTRTVRRDTPERIITQIGQRPNGGKASTAWDHAAGQYDQHQTAYGITQGLDATGSSRRLGPGYANSLDRSHNAGMSLRYGMQQQHQELTRHLRGPSLGISR